MSVTPQILLAMTQTSGSNITNYGSGGGTFPIQAGATENTDFRWVGGSYLEYQTRYEGGGASTQPYTTLGGLALGTTFSHIYVAMKFRITSYDSGVLNQGHLCWPATGGGDGGIGVRLVAPSGGGDFDLYCKGETASLFPIGTHTFTALTFGTDYSLCVVADLTSNTAVQMKFLLDAGTVQKPATTNPGGDSWSTDAGYLDRRGDFDKYGGVVGRLYYFVHGRGTLLSDGDMGTANSSPSSFFTGWPSGGGAYNAVPAIYRYTLQRARKIFN